MYVSIYILRIDITQIHTNALLTVAHTIPKIVQTLPTELVTVNSMCVHMRSLVRYPLLTSRRNSLPAHNYVSQEVRASTTQTSL